MPVIYLTDESFDREVTQAPHLVLVEFMTPDAGPCRMMSHVIEELADEYEDRVRFARIHAQENLATSKRLDVTGVPTLLMIQRGIVVERLVGPHSKLQIRNALDGIVSGSDLDAGFMASIRSSMVCSRGASTSW